VPATFLAALSNLKTLGFDMIWHRLGKSTVKLRSAVASMKGGDPSECCHYDSDAADLQEGAVFFRQP
jgi:hypothetical protein